MRQQKGFTVIELMTVVIISFTTLQLAVSSGAALLNNNRLSVTANRMVHDLFIARSEAILRNTRITISKSGENWGDGWSVFEDPNNNAILDQGEKLLQRRESLNNGLTMQGNSKVKSYISYTGGGVSRRTSGGFQAGTLMLCDKTGRANPDHARAIIIASSGRPRVTRENRDLKKRQCY